MPTCSTLAVTRVHVMRYTLRRAGGAEPLGVPGGAAPRGRHPGRAGTDVVHGEGRPGCGAQAGADRDQDRPAPCQC